MLKLLLSSIFLSGAFAALQLQTNNVTAVAEQSTAVGGPKMAVLALLAIWRIRALIADGKNSLFTTFLLLIFQLKGFKTGKFYSKT
jgi:hypothetical protein